MWVTPKKGLALPSGFLIIVFLTKKLGPAGYGLYTLEVVLVIWIESSIGALSTRTTIKLVSEAEDWKPIGASLTLMHSVTGGFSRLQERCCGAFWSRGLCIL